MEIWKNTNIGNYEVSNKGRVRNAKGRIMKTFITEGRYEKLKLTTKPNVQKTFAVHRLVAQVFIPNPDNKPTVDHKDRDSFNNNADNLRWATTEEQEANKGRIQLHEISKIRTLIENGLSDKDIYKSFYGGLAEMA